MFKLLMPLSVILIERFLHFFVYLEISHLPYLLYTQLWLIPYGSNMIVQSRYL